MAEEIKELAGNYTKAEYAEQSWAQVKQFIEELDAETQDSRDKLMQLIGFMDFTAKVYYACEW